MATTRTRKVKDTTVPSGPVLVLAQSEGVKRAPGRGASPIPAEIVSAIEWSLDSEKPGAFPGQPSEEAGKAVVSLLRRVQGELNRGADESQHCSLSTSVTETADGTWTVDFLVKRGVRNRNYTVDDIRTWAENQGVDRSFYERKIDPQLRKAYRVAHGYEREEMADGSE